MQFDAGSHDQFLGEYIRLERARLEAYEALVDAEGDKLVEYSALAARWNGIGDFWEQVRDDPSTPFLYRASANSAMLHARDRVEFCSHRAVHEQPSPD